MIVPMTRTRFHHLSVCALCMAVCFAMWLYVPPYGWQYWLLMAMAIYALQPLLNEIRAWWASMFPRREPVDPYALVGK